MVDRKTLPRCFSFYLASLALADPAPAAVEAFRDVSRHFESLQAFFKGDLVSRDDPPC